MIRNLFAKRWDRNLIAEWQMNRKAKGGQKIICQGRIQLSLSRDALIETRQAPCYIGLRLLGATTSTQDVTIIAAESGAYLCLDGVKLGRGITLSLGTGARLSIGKDSYLTNGSRILAQHLVTVGERCAISFGVTIMDDDGHGFGLPPYSAPICIEDDVWIGCNTTILKGVTLGKGSVVAAGSVVTRSCPPRSLIAGVPARIIREKIEWTDQYRAI